VDEAYIIENGIELIEKLAADGKNVNEYYRGDDGFGSPEQVRENEWMAARGIEPVYFTHTPGIHSAELRVIIKNT